MAATCDFDAIPRGVISGGSVRFFPRTAGFTKPLVSHNENISAIISQYPPAQNDTYVKATTSYGGIYPYNATDPTKSLIGDSFGNSWFSAAPTVNNRFHIDLGTAKIITKIYYENYHHLGSSLLRGVKTFIIQGSNSASAFAELTYGTDTGWTNITASVSEFDIHVGLDQADPKYFTLTNTTSYRYYAIKTVTSWGADVAGFRRVELQAANQITVPAYLWAFGDDQEFTIDGSTTDFLLANADDYFTVGDRVVLTTSGTLPTGLSAECCYWIKTVDATKFTLSTTSGGAAVIYTAATGSGTHSVQHGSDQATPVHAYPTVAAPTVYDVTLTVNDANSDTATKTHTSFIRSDAV